MSDKILEFPGFKERVNFNRKRLIEARLAKQWTQIELASRVGVTSETISNLESGQRGPGPEILSLIAEALGFPVAYFLRQDEGGELISPVFFRSFASKTKRQNLCLDSWRAWSGRLLTYIGRYVNLPPVNLPEANWASVAADDIVDRAEDLATQCRRKWKLGDGPLGNLALLTESMGVCVIRLDIDNMDSVDGFSCWQDGRPMVFLLSKQSAARERLNIAHELLHLIAHRYIEAGTVGEKSTFERVEKEAFAFAGALLLPRNTYAREVYSLSMQQFTQLKKRWGVSIAAQGNRCRDLGIMDDDRYTQFRKNLSWNKFLKTEPLDDVMAVEQPKMLEQAFRLLAEGGVKTDEQIAEDMAMNLNMVRSLASLPVKDDVEVKKDEVRLRLVV